MELFHTTSKITVLFFQVKTITPTKLIVTCPDSVFSFLF